MRRNQMRYLEDDRVQTDRKKYKRSIKKRGRGEKRMRGQSQGKRSQDDAEQRKHSLILLDDIVEHTYLERSGLRTPP